MKNKIKRIVKAALGNELYFKLQSVRIDIKNKKKNNHLLKLREKNICYKDCQAGKRCFIMGNGPSLKKVNLSDFRDEFVFTVNNFPQVNNYTSANTNVHLWMDYSFFDMREDQKYDIDILLENYKKMSKEHAICFVPYESYDFIKKYELDKILDINYLQVASVVDKHCKLFTDISKPITGFTTVVQYAVLVALHMGFTEIYLLGCDSTNIVSLLNCAQNISNSNMHAYDNDDVNERYNELLKNWTMSDVFYDQYILFLGYKKLYEECLKRGIKLYNCSDTTIINEIPRKNINDVIGKE